MAFFGSVSGLARTNLLPTPAARSTQPLTVCMAKKKGTFQPLGTGGWRGRHGLWLTGCSLTCRHSMHRDHGVHRGTQAWADTFTLHHTEGETEGLPYVKFTAHRQYFIIFGALSEPLQMTLPDTLRTVQNKRTTPGRLELKKYNPFLKRHTVHREIK